MMETSKLIFMVLIFPGLITGIFVLVLLFYIGRTRAKEIDKVVYGFEIPNDSIFFLALRVPVYGFAFLCKWYAKIVGYEDKIAHFDRYFRWPFIAVVVLTTFSIFIMILAGVLRKYYMDIE